MKIKNQISETGGFFNAENLHKNRKRSKGVHRSHGRASASKLDAFLKFNDAEILHNTGKVTAEIAKAFAESEFEQYRVLQDKSYESDFDRLIAESENKMNSDKEVIAQMPKNN